MNTETFLSETMKTQPSHWLNANSTKANEKFDERKFDIEAMGVIRREELVENATKAEAIACSEIRKLVNVFNKSLWPQQRLDRYYASLKKTEEDDKIIEELGEKISDSLRMIAKLKDEAKAFPVQMLLKTADLKSEFQFM